MIAEQLEMNDTTRPLPIQDFSPVSLDELVREAELLTRFDRKYLLPAESAAALLGDLDPRSRVLEIDGIRAFAYDSVYFDTTDHLAYRLTAHKHRHRFKIRTRNYLDTGTGFLEVKTKDGRGNTVKQRIRWDPADRSRLTPEGHRFAVERLRPHGHDRVVERLRPSLTNRYRRTTLLLPCGSRATFDTDLHWIAGDGREVRLHDYIIVESKSANRASDLDRSLWRSGHRPSAISKFGIGTAALHPELPRNKWSRALGGPLASLLD